MELPTKMDDLGVPNFIGNIPNIFRSKPILLSRPFQVFGLQLHPNDCCPLHETNSAGPWVCFEPEPVTGHFMDQETYVFRGDAMVFMLQVTPGT